MIEFQSYHPENTNESLCTLRGFTIELSKIESIICTIDNIKTSFATVFELTTGIESLIAYIILDNRNIEPPSSKKIKQILSNFFPINMIPKYFEVLDNLPTLQNGKIDRTKLPIPTQNM